MSQAIENLEAALQFGMSTRPKVGGFPYFAEVLRLAGVTRNLWTLPSCQCLYLTEHGSVVMQGVPLITGKAEVRAFNREGLIQALRTDQAGKSTFPEFLKAAWEAGVVGYDVDLNRRRVTYFDVLGEAYIEDYPAVEVKR